MTQRKSGRLRPTASELTRRGGGRRLHLGIRMTVLGRPAGAFVQPRRRTGGPGLPETSSGEFWTAMPPSGLAAQGGHLCLKGCWKFVRATPAPKISPSGGLIVLHRRRTLLSVPNHRGRDSPRGRQACSSPQRQNLPDAGEMRASGAASVLITPGQRYRLGEATPTPSPAGGRGGR